MNIYHYDNNCKLTCQTEATYDALDGSVDVPANATILTPLGAVSPDIDVFDLNNNCWTIVKYVAPIEPIVVPPTIDELRAKMVLTPAQFRINLVRDGWFSAAESAIATLPKTSNIAILWEYSLQFERLNPDLIALGVQLGMTAIQMDHVFSMEV
jgi:hypothetical protein